MTAANYKIDSAWVSAPSDMTPWVVIDASYNGEVRINHVVPGPNPVVAPVRRYKWADLVTFSDGLLLYQRETGLALRDVPSVVAIAGAATMGDGVHIARSRWTISRSGIAAILGRPPIIINEVVARAWAAQHSLPPVKRLRGRPAPDLREPGRYAFININEGVGAVALDIDEQGIVHISESEVGHLDFAPANADEAALAKASNPLAPIASWEHVLVADMDTVGITLGWDRAKLARVQAAVLGRFVVNVALAFGGWRGALLNGASVSQIVLGNEDAFDAAFHDRRNFRRLIADLGCWRIEQHEPVLMGCIALATQRSAMN